jgi:predicted MFS family arabinose efflux permease
MPPSPLRRSLHLLATRRFGSFWFASLLSSIGTWAQQVAEPWLLLTLGASSLVIGLDTFAMNAPVWALTLAGGVLADRADRRRVIAFFQSIQMLCPAAIVVLLVAGALRPWMIIALSVVVGITDALSMPSFQSIVPSIVKKGEIGQGLALNSTQFNLSRVLGPSIAGLLLSSVGAVACFVVSAVSYVPFIGIALWILPKKVPEAGAAPAAKAERPLAGIRHVLRDRTLRGALLMVLVTSTFSSPIMTFCPVLVRDAFGGRAAEYSVVLSSFGLGGLVGAGSLLALGPTVDRRLLGAGFAFLYAATVAVAAVAPRFWAVPPLLFLAGASMTVSNTAANTVLQSTVEPRLLGQAVSLYMLAMRGGISIGSLLTGVFIGRVGARHALLADGVVGMLAQAALALVALRASGPAETSRAR